MSELENKVLQDNNKGLKTKIDEQSKEIEELKAEIEELKDESKEYQIGFAQGCYEKDLDWKDKIKAKIEELKEDIKYSANPLTIDNSKFGIKVLQSLLEKE